MFNAEIYKTLTSIGLLFVLVVTEVNCSCISTCLLMKMIKIIKEKKSELSRSLYQDRVKRLVTSKENNFIQFKSPPSHLYSILIKWIDLELKKMKNQNHLIYVHNTLYKQQSENRVSGCLTVGY